MGSQFVTQRGFVNSVRGSRKLSMTVLHGTRYATGCSVSQTWFCYCGELCMTVRRLLITVPLRRRWVLKNDGTIMTGENQRSRWRTCPSATLSTINLTLTDLGPNPDLCGEKLATNLQSPLQLQTHHSNTQKLSSYLTANNTVYITKTNRLMQFTKSVIVYCVNHTNTNTNTLCRFRLNKFTLRQVMKNQRRSIGTGVLISP
jgi:hypothetical protein